MFYYKVMVWFRNGTFLEEFRESKVRHPEYFSLIEKKVYFRYGKEAILAFDVYQLLYQSPEVQFRTLAYATTEVHRLEVLQRQGDPTARLKFIEICARVLPKMISFPHGHLSEAEQEWLKAKGLPIPSQGGYFGK